MYSLNFCT